MRKAICLILSIVLIFSLTLPAFASSVTSPTVVNIYDDGITKVDGYATESGDMIFRQYINNQLVQRNTIYAGNNEIIYREFINSSRSSPTTDSISIYDYGTVAHETNGIQTATIRVAGTINYRAIIDTGYTYYGLYCIYDETQLGSTTYTINGYVGTVVDLVSIIAGAFTIPIPVVGKYVAALITGLGVTVISGYIEDRLSDTVSCIETDYEWTLTDTTYSGHSKNVYGSKYYITDVKSAAVGKTYYEGYTPNDWRTQALAVWFHNEMFAYSAWDVVSWQ